MNLSTFGQIVFFFVVVFFELWPFEHFSTLNLSARHFKKYLCKEVETWSADDEQILLNFMDLWKFRHIELVCKIPKKVLAPRTWNLVDRRWWVDEMNSFWTNSVDFYGVMALGKFRHIKFVSRMSWKVFVLRTWNLVSWLDMMSIWTD